MAKKMQEKFAKYWKKLSPILAMAVVLDPRLKFEFVEFTLEKVYPVEREMKKEVDIIRKRMAVLYKEYHTASTLRGSTTTNETQNSGTVNGGNSGRNGSAFMQEFAAEKKSGGQQSDKSELEQYLSESSGSMSTDFDILKYWRSQELRNPNLTRMPWGRVLDRYRSSLSPESVEALITTRDWIYGIGAASTDVEEVKDNDISEDVLAFEPTNNNDAIHTGAS
ncbi:zinc finger BED domain-containing protein RICESLEEPER 2-like [Papaver somniferum]|uniref:zinc finger BED domain-containing protein RICESLEEPER 2-like n=1 Tax=Papaver somniferum TaxID=3469 RepID=UPI000E6F9E7B|nr:zinc finger BED domain-containing protein RICESLEEPER 2-like [Papaver somniferum]